MKLIYTFRTNPFNKELKERFNDVFIFGKLKEDFEEFKEIVINKKHEYIIGCTKSNKSFLETKTINRFNKKNVVKYEKGEYNLFTPTASFLENKATMEYSFCDWTAYKIMRFLSENNLKSKLVFIHFKDKDFKKLIDTLEGVE